jgi:hypothetical protein
MKTLWWMLGMVWCGVGVGWGGDLRIGLIGLDTSHVVAFTRLLNTAGPDERVAGGRVVGAVQGGSADVEASRSRVEGFTRQLQEEYGVRLYDTVGELCRSVDAVILTSVDGRAHLAQAVAVMESGRPLFIDKPMAASLRDVVALFRLAAARRAPVWSSSSLRYGRRTQAVRAGGVGWVWRAETTGPCSLEPSHPDLFWYGIHGVEALFAVMGTGCEEVRRGETPDGRIEVVGRWRGGREGTFREDRSYGGRAWGSTGSAAVGENDGYRALLVEVMRFFETGVAPVQPAETIELFAFMEGADESKRRGGGWVSIDDLRRRAGDVRLPEADRVTVRRIWDAGAHNAFTDLGFRDGEWLCVFREGSGHVSADGVVRVLSSADGEAWESVASVGVPGMDARDPKICVTPQGEWMLVAVGADRGSGPVRHQTFAWFSADGRAWGDPVAIGEPDVWLWRVTWHGSEAYGVGYGTGADRFTRLYRSQDGRRFEGVVTRLFADGYPNEASLGVEAGGAMLCLLRRDGEAGTGQVGWARPPYTDWLWRDLGVRIGGPHWVPGVGGRWLAAVRRYDPSTRTALEWVDPETGGMSECLVLPSGGDTSYAGMGWDRGDLRVSYYSSHEGRSSIYLARVGFDAGRRAWSGIADLFEVPAAYANDYGQYRSPLEFGDGRSARDPEEWEVRRREIVGHWQGELGEWPALIQRPVCEVIRSEAEPEYVRHRVRVEVSAGRLEEGWLLVPHGRGPFGAVLVPFYEPDTSVGLKGGEGRDLARQLARRGLVVLAAGSPGGDAWAPDTGSADWQPLSYLAYVAANLHTVMAQRPDVDARRIGVAGHSYGGKWALFAGCLYAPFAAVAVSDPGVVWDETRSNVNYWEPWYLGWEPGRQRARGRVTAENPRTGAYKRLRDGGHDLHELHALLAPRPFFVAGGAEDPPERWRALNHLVAVNDRLGFSHRVGMSSRSTHDPTDESNRQIGDFFEHFLAGKRP